MLESNQRIHRVLDNLNIPVTKRWRVYESTSRPPPKLSADYSLQRSQFVAFTQSEQGEGGAGVGDEVVLVVVGGAGEPPTTFALVGLEPGDSLSDGWMIWR